MEYNPNEQVDLGPEKLDLMELLKTELDGKLKFEEDKPYVEEMIKNFKNNYPIIKVR